MSETNGEPDARSEEEGYDNPGVEGQIQYPEPEVDAAHAAAFAAGLEDTLYPEGDPRNETANPADNPNELVDEEGNPVDEEGNPVE